MIVKKIFFFLLVVICSACAMKNEMKESKNLWIILFFLFIKFVSVLSHEERIEESRAAVWQFRVEIAACRSKVSLLNITVIFRRRDKTLGSSIFQEEKTNYKICHAKMSSRESWQAQATNFSSLCPIELE